MEGRGPVASGMLFGESTVVATIFQSENGCSEMVPGRSLPRDFARAVTQRIWTECTISCDMELHANGTYVILPSVTYAMETPIDTISLALIKVSRLAFTGVESSR